MRWHLFQGKMPIQVVGTFVNGLLEGNAKIVLQNQELIIGSYQRGGAHGLLRVWNSEGALTFVGFYQDGVRIGRCW